MTDDRPDAAEVLRALWAANGQGATDLDGLAADSGAKPCRNMKDVTFDGMAEPGSDLGAAWRERLRAEGKLTGTGGTIRDLVLGDPDR